MSPLSEATVAPVPTCKGDLQCHLHLLWTFPFGVQASNSSLPKRDFDPQKKKKLALIFVKGRAGEGTKKWGKQKINGADVRKRMEG